MSTKIPSSYSVTLILLLIAIQVAMSPRVADSQDLYPSVEALVPRLESYPSLTSDGRYLVYSAGEGFDLDLYRLDLVTMDVRELTDNEHEDSAASWSPDGKTIVFQREEQGGNRDIWEIDAAGRIEKNLTNSPETREQHPRYTPSGSAIVFDGNMSAVRDGDSPDGTENYEIYILQLESAEVRRLTTWDLWDMYPSLSPEEDRLVWRRALPTANGDRPNFEIFVQDLDSGETFNLTNHPAADTNPHWSPAGDWIVFASNRDGSSELYVMRPDGTGVRRLTNGGSRSISYGRPSFSGDGAKIVANRFIRGVTDMVVLNFPGGSSVDGYDN